MGALTLRQTTAPRLCLAGALCVALCAGAALAPAAQGASRADLRDTFLLSKAASGDIPNGASRNPSISMDARYSRVAAFESDASNIVGGDTNGKTDVFAVFRTGSFTNQGEPWVPGETRLVSRGLGGAPANGPSYEPDVSGDPELAPRCVAFVSRASNLVKGDSNGKADVFVYDIKSRKIERVSVDARGKQANGDSFDVAVDGDCDRLVFTSNATNLALTGTGGARGGDQKAAWKGLVTKGGRGRQVYMHLLRAGGIERFLEGVTFLVSANDRGAVLGESFEPDIDIKRGDRVVFASTGALSPKDSNGRTDVYLRALNEVVLGKGKGPPNTLRSFKPRTQLVSARSDGRAGGGDSRRPSADGFARYVYYDTTAPDILPGDSNGVSDVIRADTKPSPPLQQKVSETSGIQGNGASFRGIASTGGTNGIFLTNATNFEDVCNQGASVPGKMVLWTANRLRGFVQSCNSDEDPLSLPVTEIALSTRTNYILMQTASPFADRRVVNAFHPEWNRQPDAIDAQAAQDPRFTQVYLRYTGPE